MTLFCPNGFAFSNVLADPVVAQTFDITGTDNAVSVLRANIGIDSSDGFAGELNIYFESTATGVFVTLTGGYSKTSELFKIPTGTTHLTVTGSPNTAFSLTTGQMI